MADTGARHVHCAGNSTVSVRNPHEPFRMPRVNFGVRLYPLGHSLVTFLLVFAVASLLARRLVIELLGWLSHILIDVRFNGLPWWTPWFWCATCVALAVLYFLLWRKGWLTRTRPPA